jgi:hypothetical protein
LRNPKSKFKISEKRKTQTFYLLLFISSLFWFFVSDFVWLGSISDLEL